MALVKACLAAVLALGLLTGCAAERWSYGKADMTPARLDQDLEACRRLAHRPHQFALTRAARVDGEKLNRCMEEKGYTPRREP
jgi:hypothetical protein